MSTKTPGHSEAASEPGAPELHVCLPHGFYLTLKSRASPPLFSACAGVTWSSAISHCWPPAPGRETWLLSQQGHNWGIKTRWQLHSISLLQNVDAAAFIEMLRTKHRFVPIQHGGVISENFQKKLYFCSFLGGTSLIFLCRQMWEPNLP